MELNNSTRSPIMKTMKIDVSEQMVGLIGSVQRSVDLLNEASDMIVKGEVKCSWEALQALNDLGRRLRRNEKW